MKVALSRGHELAHRAVDRPHRAAGTALLLLKQVEGVLNAQLRVK